MKMFAQALRLLVIMALLTGLLYPLLITSIARLAFPERSRGSLVYYHGRPVGSALLAQKFVRERYFRPRPSAGDYETIPSAASNLGLSSARLKRQWDNRKKTLGDEQKRYSGGNAVEIPADLLFASGSGIDPHISPESVVLQIERVCRVRNFSLAQRRRLREVIANLTEGPILGFMGEARVNVLLLNLALDDIK